MQHVWMHIAVTVGNHERVTFNMVIKLYICSVPAKYPHVVLPSQFAGKNLPLLPVARVLFNHVWDVLKDVPSFQSEYSVLLRHLLAVTEYRFHIRKRVYSSEYFSDLVCHCVC